MHPPVALAYTTRHNKAGFAASQCCATNSNHTVLEKAEEEEEGTGIRCLRPFHAFSSRRLPERAVSKIEHEDSSCVSIIGGRRSAPSPPPPSPFSSFAAPSGMAGAIGAALH